MDRVLGSLRDQHIVLPIASDPAHPLHARAIDALAFNFEAHQGLAIAAMLHHDPAVRRAGVTTLLWEEPTDAVPGLLVCLDDDDTGVRHEAENTLQYFPDRRVLRRLVGSQGETFASLLDDFASSLMSNPALADWMRDVLDVVEPMLVSLSDDGAPPAAEGQALRGCRESCGSAAVTLGGR